MLYIYKIEDIYSPYIIQCVTDAQKMHQFLCKLIQSDRASANLLYKLDKEHGYLFVQSDIKPEDSHYLKLLYTLDVDEILARKANQQEIHFRLTTDTHKKKTTDGVTKKVYVPSDEVIPWLRVKLARYGVDAYKVQEIQKQNTAFTHEKGNGGYANITTHDFDIFGVITDIEAFKKAWHTGMGEHKAYGNGLFLMCC